MTYTPPQVCPHCGFDWDDFATESLEAVSEVVALSSVVLPDRDSPAFWTGLTDSEVEWPTAVLRELRWDCCKTRLSAEDERQVIADLGLDAAAVDLAPREAP